MHPNDCSKKPIEQLPAIAQDPDKFGVLLSAAEFRTHLVESIRQARKRIYLVALYLENDDAGREILTELYAAKQRNPGLEIHICVDWHRAQRGLIGAAESEAMQPCIVTLLSNMSTVFLFMAYRLEGGKSLAFCI